MGLNFAQDQLLTQEITIEDLRAVDKPVPRYTSYPPAPQWSHLSSEVYCQRLRKIPSTEKLSVYIHIPFCQKMCLFCGCTVILNRKDEKRKAYLNYLFKEIDLVAQEMDCRKKRIAQLHFGGGTPTSLTEDETEEVLNYLSQKFGFEADAELAMEIDPRTVCADEGKKLTALAKMGFNRVSFGVQDTSWKVQDAIARRQSAQMSAQTIQHAKSLGFDGINLDLIYGLPLQTIESFTQTAQDIIDWKPSRIALYSFAYVPWLKGHQKALRLEDMPKADEKLKLYLSARHKFLQSGYKSIGMDHFALESDELYQSFLQGNLQRNFQGYSVNKASQLLGFGISATGYVSDCYVQNEKELKAYYEALDESRLPVLRGHAMSQDDLMRKWVIHTLMCRFYLSKTEFFQRFHCNFDDYFVGCERALDRFALEEYLVYDKDGIEILPKGQLLIRLVVCEFDKYLKLDGVKRFSRSI